MFRFNLILKALKISIGNKIVQYLASRYFTFMLQFINSMLIAVFLGPYYLGIWGFINLVIKYFQRIDFGISASLNNVIATHKKSKRYVAYTFNTAISMVACLSLLVAILFTLVYLFDIQVGAKYNFSKYAGIVCIIVIVAYFNSIFMHLYRVHNDLMKVAFHQSIFPVLTFFCLIFFRQEKLLYALVWTNLAAYLLIILFYMHKAPIKIRPIIVPKSVKELFIRGQFLFIHNFSFYMIIFSIKSFISGYFSVEEFGYFTFAYSFANAVMLFSKSFPFVLLPKLINRFSDASNEYCADLIYVLRNKYMTVVHGLTYFMIACFPVFLLLFPNYYPSKLAFVAIAVSQVILSNNYGHDALLKARRKEKKIATSTFITLIISIALAFLLLNILVLQYYHLIFVITFTYIVMGILINFYSNRELNINNPFLHTIQNFFPVRVLIPFSASIIICFINVSGIYLSIPFLLFIVLNIKDIGQSLQMMKKIINNSSIADV